MIEAGSKKSGFSSVLSLLFFDGGFRKQTNKQTNRLSVISPEKQRFYTVLSEAELSRGKNSQEIKVIISYYRKCSCFLYGSWSRCLLYIDNSTAL